MRSLNCDHSRVLYRQNTQDGIDLSNLVSIAVNVGEGPR
jgi:hypothetical protein